MQQGNLIREDVLGSLAENNRRDREREREKKTVEHRRRAAAPKAAAPVNNSIPESAVLNKVC